MGGEIGGLREEFQKCCREVGGRPAVSVGYGSAAITNRKIDQAGGMLQDLLSAIEDEQQRNVLLQVSKCLEGAHMHVECHDLAGDDSEGSDAEERGGRATAIAVPPARWMRGGQGTSAKGEKGKSGRAGKQERLGNVAEKFALAQEQAGKPPTHSEEVEMARRAVSAADDRYKGQLLSEESKRSILEEASREMAVWIQSSSARLHAGSTGDECAAGMETMARCRARVEEAVKLPAARRQEEAQAAAVAAGVGVNGAATGV